MKTLLRSNELSCPSCVAKIESSLKALRGVDGAAVHFNTGKIEISHDPDEVSQEQLIKTVRDAGYESRVARM